MASEEESDAPPAGGDWATAAELSSMTDVWHRLLADHVPAGDGRCRACTQGGTGIPTARWPCGPRLVAEAAARHHAARNGAARNGATRNGATRNGS